MSESENVSSIYSHMRALESVYPSYMTGINSAIAGGNIQDILKNSIAGSMFMNDSIRYYQEEIKRNAEMMKSVAGDSAINALQQIGANLSSFIGVGSNIGSSELMIRDDIKRQYEMMQSIYGNNLGIYSTLANSILVPETDEEISIKKSQWNDLQEELATKEKRIHLQDEKISNLEKRVSELENVDIPKLDRKVDDSMNEFHTNMEKNMPEVLHVSGYLRSMESNLGDPDDNLEQ